jgi:hypothetical protein
MKKLFFYSTAVIVFAGLYSCSKDNNKPIIPGENGNGTLLIYSMDSALFRTCGPSILVTLQSGQQSIITNYYTAVPATCQQQLGGYFTLPAGDYSFTATTIGACDTLRGTATVDSNACKIVRLR